MLVSNCLQESSLSIECVPMDASGLEVTALLASAKAGDKEAADRAAVEPPDPLYSQSFTKSFTGLPRGTCGTNWHITLCSPRRSSMRPTSVWFSTRDHGAIARIFLLLHHA